MLAVLFFALLTVVLVPATTAQAACSVVGQPCVRDDFDSRAYDLNTGTDDWATDWAETGESDGPELGVILVPVSLGELRFQAVFGSNEENYAITRNVDIPAAANNATLRLNVGYEGTLGSSKFLEVTANSIPFGIISGSAVPNPATYSYDLDSVLGPIGGTTISVRLTNLDDLADTPDFWYIDFVEVTYDSPLAVTLADFSAQQRTTTCWWLGKPAASWTTRASTSTAARLTPHRKYSSTTHWFRPSRRAARAASLLHLGRPRRPDA
ncbi:MAG: hypothetical protein M9927_16695 [Anaerolineae bacterium]|nr:hypothetical protein [Anaerolineae bacterium]